MSSPPAAPHDGFNDATSPSLSPRPPSTFLTLPSPSLSNPATIASQSPNDNHQLKRSAIDYSVVTLSITSPDSTYITAILLGNSFPSSTSPTIPYTYTVATTPPVPDSPPSHNGISSSAVVAIVLGIIVALSALFYAWFYVLPRRRKNAKKKKKVKGKGGEKPKPNYMCTRKKRKKGGKKKGKGKKKKGEGKEGGGDGGTGTGAAEGGDNAGGGGEAAGGGEGGE